ncbi:MAG TPA: family 20 glycosylhydrolase, partial [Terriglobales bacterium]
MFTATAFAQHINLVPEVKELKPGAQPFRIAATTRIIVNARYAKEDRLAAETLADEIESATGRRPRIVNAASSSRTANAILLTRLTDATTRRKLQAHGLMAEPNFNQEGYLLDASATGVMVAGQSAAGLFYGVQTLRQLVQPEQSRPGAPASSEQQHAGKKLPSLLALRSNNASCAPAFGRMDLTYSQPLEPKLKLASARLKNDGLIQTSCDDSFVESAQTRASANTQERSARVIIPAVAIKDWPTVRWRGVHDDVSRGPIPTLEYMKKQIRTLAEYKINLFSIYMENVFDYANQPLIAPKEAAITPLQIEELVTYAKQYFVTILPEQQAFGHLHHVLKYELYNDLAETPHGHVLAPVNDKSYDLIKSMYAELVPLFPSPLFHIGSDETFELGRGQSKAKADQVGLGRVYLEHLERVSQILQPYGKRLMFWADIAQKYPDLLNILPKQMIPVAWEYDPRPSFENMLQPFRAAGFDMFVSPGANNWNRIYPNFDAAYVNIHNFVRDGQKFAAIGVLNTTWDDDGETLFEMTWPALVYGAAASWQPVEAPVDKFQSNFDWAFYRNTNNAFIQASNQLSQTHRMLRDVKLGGAFNSLFWEDPFTEQGAQTVLRALPAMHDFRIAAESAITSIYQHQPMARAHSETLEAMLLAGWRLDALGMKIQFTKEINDYYWDAYLNQTDGQRVSRDLSEIS